MTEKEIIVAMEFCAKEECHKCPRQGSADCATKLYSDAIGVMKLMHNAVEAGSEAINNLKVENALLKAGCRYSFTEKDLVKAVNNIVHFCLDNDEDEEGNQDVNIIRAMLDLGKLLPSGGTLVIHPNSNAPELKLGK